MEDINVLPISYAVNHFSQFVVYLNFVYDGFCSAKSLHFKDFCFCCYSEEILSYFKILLFHSAWYSNRFPPPPLTFQSLHHLEFIFDIGWDGSFILFYFTYEQTIVSTLLWSQLILGASPIIYQGLRHV